MMEQLRWSQMTEILPANSYLPLPVNQSHLKIRFDSDTTSISLGEDEFFVPGGQLIVLGFDTHDAVKLVFELVEMTHLCVFAEERELVEAHGNPSTPDLRYASYLLDTFGQAFGFAPSQGKDLPQRPRVTLVGIKFPSSLPIKPPKRPDIGPPPKMIKALPSEPGRPEDDD